MTTESLSPASRIVIETSSRPPGERSTSISRIGGVEGAEPGPSALARGATSAGRALEVEPSNWNAAPAAKGADGGAPNRSVCAAGGAAEVTGSGGRPPAALPLDSAGAWTAAEVATRAAGGGAETSAFCPLCAASCAAARVAPPRCVGGAPERAATAVGDAAVAIGGTASAEAFAGGSAGEKPTVRARSPLRADRAARSAAEAAPGANGVLIASVAARNHSGGSGGAEVERAFADQSPDGRRFAAGDKGRAAALGFRAFHRRRGERRRTVRGLPAFVHRRGGPQGEWQSRQERAVVEQRMTTRLSTRGLVPRRVVRGTRLFLARAGGPLSPTRREANSSTAPKANGSAGGRGARRGTAGAIGPDAGAAAGAVMANLQFVLAARGSTCVEAHPAPARSSVRARWAYSCRRRAERRRFPY